MGPEGGAKAAPKRLHIEGMNLRVRVFCEPN